jgi:PAS domain S-box-containing protein
MAACAGGTLTEIRGVSSKLRRFGDRQFVEGTFSASRPLRETDVGHLVLLQDWAPTQAFLNELQTALLLTGVGGFALALAGGLVFSRRTSRPLMDMAAAAQGIADGDWSRIVAARGSTETTILAKAFNDMTHSLRDQAAHLKASAQRFSTVTQSARDAIVSTDGEGHITFWNRSAEAMFGYAEQEVLGNPVAMLLAESDRAAYHAALPTPDADDLQFGRIIEVTALRKQGGTFSGELRWRPCADRAASRSRPSFATSLSVGGAGCSSSARGAASRGTQDGSRRPARWRRARDFNNVLMPFRATRSWSGASARGHAAVECRANRQGRDRAGVSHNNCWSSVAGRSSRSRRSRSIGASKACGKRSSVWSDRRSGL